MLLLRSIPGTLNTEKFIHKKFTHLRREGSEWFSISEDLLSFISDPQIPPLAPPCKINTKFSEELKRFLNQKGWTAAEFARRAKISKAVVSKWMLYGTVPHEIFVVKRVSDALGVSLDYFLPFLE
jgi:hypothetical protein